MVSVQLVGGLGDGAQVTTGSSPTRTGSGRSSPAVVGVAAADGGRRAGAAAVHRDDRVRLEHVGAAAAQPGGQLDDGRSVPVVITNGPASAGVSARDARTTPISARVPLAPLISRGRPDACTALRRRAPAPPR